MEPDKDEPGPDGTISTIEARLQKHVKRCAEDIKNCANMCDAYSKEKFFVRVLKSSSWDEKFKIFFLAFGDRRKAFALALEIHTGKKISEAQHKLDTFGTKLDVILSMFSTLVSSEQQHLENLIRSRGGAAAVVVDDAALTELLKSLPSSSGLDAMEHAPDFKFDHPRLGNDRKDALRILKEELFETADVAISKNLETFERKFVMQERRMYEEMQGVVRHESDRVINRVLGGPHTRIRDPVSDFEVARIEILLAHMYKLRCRSFVKSGRTW